MSVPVVDMSDEGVRLRFHRNEAPLPPPDHVIRAIRTIDPDMLRTYPIDAQRALFAELAERLDVRQECVAIGNGADEILAAVSRATLQATDNALTVSPTFGMYARSIALTGADVRAIPYERRWMLEVKRMLAATDERTRLVLLGNPNNPTGDALDAKIVRQLSVSLPEATIAIDEVYLAMSERSLLKTARSLPNVVIIGSLSKTAGLAGMRIGYAVGSAEMGARLRAQITPFPLSAATIAAARAYIGDRAATRAYEMALASQVRRSLDAIVAALAPFATTVWRGATNFALFEFGPDAPLIEAELRYCGIAVRRLPDPALCNMIRISAGNDRDTDELIAAVRLVIERVRG